MSRRKASQQSFPGRRICSGGLGHRGDLLDDVRLVRFNRVLLLRWQSPFFEACYAVERPTGAYINNDLKAFQEEFCSGVVSWG